MENEKKCYAMTEKVQDMIFVSVWKNIMEENVQDADAGPNGNGR